MDFFTVGANYLAQRLHASGFKKFFHIMKSAAALVENPAPGGGGVAGGQQQILLA